MKATGGRKRVRLGFDGCIGVALVEERVAFQVGETVREIYEVETKRDGL